MKTRTKILLLITVLLICTWILRRPIRRAFSYIRFVVEQYHLRKTDLYIKTYSQVYDDLIKNGFNQDTPDYFIKQYGGNTHEIVLIQEYGYRPIVFNDIIEVGDMERNLAITDEYYDYIEKRFGKTFWIELDKKANAIDSLYKPEQQSIKINGLIKQNFVIRYDSDSNQIGYLNSQIFNNSPFTFIIDTVFKNNWFRYEIEKDSFVFKAMNLGLVESKKNLKLPSIGMIVYWDSTKSRYPYPEIPLGKFYIYQDK